MTATLLDYKPSPDPLDVAANDTLAQFAKITEELSVEIGRMSAFFVVVFDDQGNPMSGLYMGEMFPLPSPMVPDVVRECAVSNVYRTGE